MSTQTSLPHVEPPAYVGHLIQRAEQLIRSGRDVLGRDLFAAAIAADPTPSARIAYAIMLAETDSQQAIAELEAAWDQARRLRSSCLRAVCCRNLSQLHQQRGEDDLAARYTQYALRAEMDQAEFVLEGALSAELLIDLSGMWSTTSDATWAEGLLRAAAGSPGDVGRQATIALHRGVLAARAGQSQDAILHLAEAQRLYREAGDLHGLAYTLLNLGHVLQSRQRLTTAHRAFRMARDLFAEQGKSTLSADAHRFALEAAARDRLHNGQADWN